jgi:hypothetical protein
MFCTFVNPLYSQTTSRSITAFLIFVDVVGRLSTQISQPGDIRREYELHIHKLEEESRKKLEAERRASEDLICKIMVGMILSRTRK